MFNKIQSFYNQASAQKLILLFTLISLAIAWRLIYIQHGWVNNDFAIYHEAARLFTINEWKQGLAVFGWPFYSVLISLVHQASGLDIANAARLLTVVFFSITTYSFLTLIYISSHNKLAIACGALILFSSHYIVGDVLPMLLRDPGFWAFFTSSLIFFIRFYKTGNLQDALYWQLCAIIATLFRIEGITYLIGLPLLLLFTNSLCLTKRLRQFLIANSISLLALISITAAILFSNNLTMQSLGRLNEIFTPTLYQELTSQFFNHANIMANQVLGSYLDDYAVQGLLLTFTYIVLIKAISTTGIISTGLAFFAIKESKNNLIDKDALRIFIATAIIALINSALIITKIFVLSSRYVVPLAFVLMVIAAIYLAHQIQLLAQKSAPQAQNNKKKWLTIVILAVFSLYLIKNVLPKGEGFNYQQEAVSWLKQVNVNHQPVFYDGSRMRYFANEKYIGSWGENWVRLNAAIKNNSIEEYHYLMVSHSKRHPEREKILAEKLPQFKEIKRFYGQKSKLSVAIYEKKTN